jgi:hypothetical protein
MDSLFAVKYSIDSSAERCTRRLDDAAGYIRHGGCIVNHERCFLFNYVDKPVCRVGQKMSYGGAKGLTSEVECHVESKPSATSFRWAFNGSGELLDLTPGQRAGGTKDGSTSILRYTPRNHLDFGTLLCWATNPLGTQSQPCVFHFYAAGTVFIQII